MRNESEDISYKPAFEASHASDALATPVASVQQHQPIKSSVSKALISSDQTSYQNKNKSKHASYMKENKSEDIQHQSTNDVVSAKIICHTNFKKNDFVSAEVITTSNEPVCDRPTYDQSADTLSPIDILPPALYKSNESNQTRLSIHVKSNVD